MRYKKRLALLCMVCSFTAVVGCGTPEKAKDSAITEGKNSSGPTEQAEEEKSGLDVTENAPEEEIASETEKELEEEIKEEIEAAEEPETEEGFSFADVSNLEFWFGSGAGAWRTVLYINEDGTFGGQYEDWDSGGDSEEAPKGQTYLSDFHGKFTEPEKVNDYTYSVRIERLELRHEPNTEEFKAGMHYIYSEPYGLDEAENILIYLPGIPVAEVSEEFMSWAGRALTSGAEELTFYGLYNETPGYGFSSSEISNAYATVKKELEDVEAAVKSLEDKIQTGELTQIELNETTAEIYRLWDDELNQIWGYLKSELNEEMMKQITADEREWISYKESEILNAGADYGDGSMRAAVENDKGAELTRARVYELAEYLR